MGYFNQTVWTDGVNIVRLRQVGEYMYTCKDLLTGKYIKFGGCKFWTSANLTDMLTFNHFHEVYKLYNNYNK